MKRVGALDAAPADRSLEQTETVAFWAVHAPGWGVIARNIAIARNLDAHDHARLLALVGMAVRARTSR